MLKPGRNSTSFPPAWNHGQTQTIRVPVALAEQILEYAYAIDSGLVVDQYLFLKTLDCFIKQRIAEFHPNQYSRTGSTTSRRWDELRRFKKAIALGTISKSELTSQSHLAAARH
ncbi:MAG: hypothetical protein KME52_30255 [Desmonostoc geniculatum HA4340-LM1]|jgi:hypothetical protein|nr:hypothetical protein [Desmonostoc geniculatum HA4340-LM1]